MKLGWKIVGNYSWEIVLGIEGLFVSYNYFLYFVHFKIFSQ